MAESLKRIFMAFVKINHDTMMEYLAERLAFARISDNKQLGNSLRIAIEVIENNKDKL